MREQEVRNLWEAYLEVCEAKDETEEGITGQPIPKRKLGPAKRHEFENKRREERKKRNDPRAGNSFSQHRMTGSRGHGSEYKNTRSVREEVETDLFDTILEHLVSEGYADTNEAALVIMANMSEEWRESIINESLLDVVRGVGKVAGNVAKDVKDRVTGKKELIGGPQGYVKVGGPSKPGDVKVSGIGPVGTYGKRTTPTGTNSPAATMSMRAR